MTEIPLPRPVSKLVEDCEATVTLPNNRRARRRMFRMLRHCAVRGYGPMCSDSNDPDTVHCSFKGRLLRDLPIPNRRILREFHAFVRQLLRDTVAKCQPLAFEEWLLTTTYTEGRKAELREANAQLRGGRPTRRQCQHVDSFVKTEYYTTWKLARMINSRCDAFKAWSGPRFKAIENVVYQLPQFVKHIPVADRPAAIARMKQAGSIYYQTDFKAFESAMTSQFMRVCECELYKWCLGDNPDTTFLNSVISGKNRMRTRTGIKAACKGRRMSGDMCTSLGNGFTNWALAKFIATRKGGSISGFVEGDDGLFASTVEITKGDYAELGFDIVINRIDDPCEASFCGMVFGESGEIIRDPVKFMMGFGWTHSHIHAGPQICDQLLRAKALSSVYENPQCPIIGAFSRYALSKTTGVVPRFVDDGYHIAPDVREIPKFNPAPSTRTLFAKIYGISIPMQHLVEAAVTVGDFDLVAELLPPSPAQAQYASNYVVVT